MKRVRLYLPGFFAPALSIALGAFALCFPLTKALCEEPPRSGYAPDPPPQASKKQWLLKLAVREGKPRIQEAKLYEIPKPLATSRMMGRYAFELYVGKELLDRLRFNVPLLGEGPPEGHAKRALARPRFDQVSVKLSIQIADQPRATRALLLDRATGEEQHFSWPPDAEGKLVPLEQALAKTKASASAKDPKESLKKASEPEKKPGPAPEASAPAPDGKTTEKPKTSETPKAPEKPKAPKTPETR